MAAPLPSLAAVRSTCPYCGVGCGVLATPGADGRVEITGDTEHPANFGRLCSKGAALGETLDTDDRLLHPTVDRQRVTWEIALDVVAKRFSETIAAHGPDSVAFYVSGQLLTEDYYVANKLMKGFIGSANIDTNSRLCMASSVAGHKRAFGSDTVPGCYEDIELADTVVLVGSNLAWCHPVLFQRLEAARAKRGTKIVVIDPRRTTTCEIADIHLTLAPGTDVALFNGLLACLASANANAPDYIARHTIGYEAAIDAASHLPIGAIAEICGLTPTDILAFYDLFASTERVVTIYSQGVNQSIAGTDKVNAIINCHLATGRIGRPGMGPFSVTGQPNAMGGREVGGLANMLAAHMELSDPEHRRIVQDFWASPRIADTPGFKAVDMFRAVGDGRIKAIWIMATNPVDSMPEADKVREALAACPFVVVSDVVRDTDTTAHADVLLPSTAWGEKNGTVTNSERRISRQRAFLCPPGDATPDWWQMAEVAKRMGFASQFNWSGPDEIFSEYARLTTVGNAGRRDLDLSDFADLTAVGYDALPPLQWPRQQPRMFANGNFFHADQKARFIATPYRMPASQPSAAYPLILNTGRIRDQWHTMTRTAKTPRLLNHIAEPFIEIHPDDAQTFGLRPAALATVASPVGRVILRVVLSAHQRRGSVFAPIHWTDQLSSAGRISKLTAGHVDPISGQPELKATPVTIGPFNANWYAFAVLRHKPARLSTSYWALARATGGWRMELADTTEPDDWTAYAHKLIGGDVDTELLAYHDDASGQHRFAAFAGEQLLGAVYIARCPVAVSRSWSTATLSASYSDPRARFELLAGRPGKASVDKGAIICACFEVGQNEIAAVIRSGQCKNTTDVGSATRAGTNCGSCRSEIGRMFDAA